MSHTTAATTSAIPGGSPRRRWSSVLVALAIVAVAVAGACGDAPTEPREDPLGVVAGNVVLLGADTIPNHAGTTIMLYRTADDLAVGRAAYATMLNQPAPTWPRRFLFRFSSVEPGEYYVLACFVFGCGEYRERVTGALLTIRVNAHQTTNLSFGL